MFNFRIISLANGNQVIDNNLKTLYNSLTLAQMEEYIEVDCQLAFMERQKKKEQKKAERKRKLARNPLYRLACFCGMV